ncbi:GNAT family N-acetyltransferase [Oceanobacter mangrovi]|uniref:GNAT family N-acetyltransferase n=1 Tax=Oceanobacter mangrovi TaxID=2862510 RepID=UPI001C8D9CF4|nr:GNAT family N-acetyltransferase [Oceanobacter mangrovi]
MSLVILNLQQVPELIPTLAHWHLDEWQALYPFESLVDFENDLRRSLNTDLVPSTWVLLQDGELVGSASLLDKDMNANEDLGPWLANVYVHPPFRGKGLARLLIKQVLQQADAGGFENIYLFTEGHRDWYQQQGWQPLRRHPYEGAMVDVMKWTM